MSRYLTYVINEVNENTDFMRDRVKTFGPYVALGLDEMKELVEARAKIAMKEINDPGKEQEYEWLPEDKDGRCVFLSEVDFLWWCITPLVGFTILKAV